MHYLRGRFSFPKRVGVNMSAEDKSAIYDVLTVKEELKVVSDNQPVIIQPDAKLSKNLEEFARKRGISTEEAINVILSDMLKPGTLEPENVSNDARPQVKKSTPGKTYSEKSVSEAKVKAAMRIIVDIAIRIVEEKKAAEADAKEVVGTKAESTADI